MHPTRTALHWLAPLVIALIAALAPIPQRPIAEEDGPLAPLAFMAGTWASREPGMALEETWSSAEGAAMVGMMRWEQNGELFLYELMSIEPNEGEAPVLRIRHFGANLEPWKSEQHTPAISFTLSEQADTRAVFDAPDRTSPGRIVYERDGDTLAITLQNVDENRELVSEQGFTLKRVK